MTFGLPLALLALALVPLMAGLYWLAQRRRRVYAIRFTNLDLLGQVAPRGPGIRRHLPAALFLLALAALAVSFSRPAAAISVPGDRSNLMLVIDTSGSMQATDVQPTRIDAARAAAKSLIDNLSPTTSVGLVGFSATAYVVAPLTGDHQSVEDSMQLLRARGGTAIGDGLALALDQLEGPTASGSSQQRPPSMIVLLTDGVSNAGVAPEEAAARAATDHIPVETIGVGSQGAQPVFVLGQDVGGVDEQELRNIAQTTGGHFFFASEAGQLQSIYSSLGARFGWRQERVDLTVPVVIAGTVLLVACAGLSMRWFRLLP
jgi:Ca-activated chloride channel family protein